MSPARMERVERATRVALEFFSAMNRHDVSGMAALFRDDCIFEDSSPPPGGTLYSGRESIARHWETFFDAFPEARVEVTETFGSGNRCVVRREYSWAGEGGRTKRIRGSDIFRIQDGTIREMYSFVKGPAPSPAPESRSGGVSP